MRKGNTIVKEILCEVANSAIRTKSQFKEKYKALVIRRGYKRAVMAVAHKILRVIHHVLTHKKYYKDPSVDYETLVRKKKIPRWIQVLIKANFIEKPKKKSRIKS